jgi:hypothetical protein
MKNYFILILSFLSLSTFANCKVFTELQDLVIGDKYPVTLITKKLKAKGYSIVKQRAEATYSLYLNRSTAMYQGNGPGFFQTEVDDLNGDFTNLSTGERVDISEYRDVYFLGLRPIQSLRVNVKRALKKLPRCGTVTF